MRNDLFVFKIFIPTPYCWQKKDFNQNDSSLSFAVTCCHLLSFVITRYSTRCHQLPFVVPLVVICCHSILSLSDFLSMILGKHLKIISRHLHVLCKINALTKSKMLKENVESCFSKLNLCLIKTILHHRQIVAC